jgi:hypothetical protein
MKSRSSCAERPPQLVSEYEILKRAAAYFARNTTRLGRPETPCAIAAGSDAVVDLGARGGKR